MAKRYEMRIRRHVSPVGQRVLSQGSGSQQGLVMAENEEEVSAILDQVLSEDLFTRAILLTKIVKAALRLPRNERQHSMSTLLQVCKRGNLLIEFLEVATRLKVNVPVPEMVPEVVVFKTKGERLMYQAGNR